MMNLLPVDSTELIEIAAEWMAEERNHKWLDFGNGAQVLTPVALRVMVQKENQLLRVFTSSDGETPIGIMGLTNIKTDFRTATLWGVLGAKEYSTKGYAPKAGRLLLDIAFKELKLNAVDAWAVSRNYASLRMINTLCFKPAGVYRNSHIINGRVYDRYLFDMLADEYWALGLEDFSAI